MGFENANGSRRRVVVTGIGIVSPLGLDAPTTWTALAAGRSGVGKISRFDASEFPVRIAAEVEGFEPETVFGRRRAKHLDRVSQFALVAAGQAMAQSGLDVSGDTSRIGTMWGTGIGGIHSLEEGLAVLDDRGPDWVSPYTLPMMIPNMVAGHVAMEWGLRGYSSCTVTACSASAQAIGESLDLIRAGRVDAVVCGGAEASITRVGVAGFGAMKALSTRNDDPEAASRPFDAGRDGFVMGEGAAALILEERAGAVARGATILAEVVGYGATSDAYHMTQPHPEADGAVRSMREALADAGLAPADVGYINAHGTSTPPNDRIETLALKKVFGERVPPVSSTKSMTGHTLGAAGALEAAVCVLALGAGTLPPTINQEMPDPECDLDYVANAARADRFDVALTNSFGFGGHNASLIISRG
ncbi:MAG TPA: beta-ketoacyl-ACP synthase II [Acidimicrobiales bacterium]|jgi:3-oxoacyl-[acyl-carrier-protein] synthase II|nr:beta-ketoacyl-ACP synthase II [Acidimicrobiales bacterium]